MYLFLLTRIYHFSIPYTFTFHNVSISTIFGTSTILLHKSFTFHNVSISTQSRKSRKSHRPTLHSTMYLFLLSMLLLIVILKLSLHSTMYLFLLSTDSIKFSIVRLFTFHNVSISTPVAYGGKDLANDFTFHNVSISTSWRNNADNNSALYIPQCIYFYKSTYVITATRKNFTFHNVSISTDINK